MGCCLGTPQRQASSAAGRRPRRRRRGHGASPPNGLAISGSQIDRRGSQRVSVAGSGSPSLIGKLSLKTEEREGSPPLPALPQMGTTSTPAETSSPSQMVSPVAVGRAANGGGHGGPSETANRHAGTPMSPVDSPPTTPKRGRSEQLQHKNGDTSQVQASAAREGSAFEHANGHAGIAAAGGGPSAAGGLADDAGVDGASDSLSYVDSVASEAVPAPYEDSRKRPMPGCLNLIEVLSSKVLSTHPLATPTPTLEPRHVPSQRRRLSGRQSTAGRLCAGFSLTKRDMSRPWTDIVLGYEDGDAEHFSIRSLDYMKSKVKVHSAASIYKLVSADMVSFDRKQNHIAKLISLPPAPQARHRMSSTSDACFPPLLVINLQLPSYAPSIFGGSNDGLGWSVIFYFALPDEFDPVTFPNQKALGLFRRFVQNGKEADGTKTRERFKIIPRVVNVEEWATKGPLSTAEHKLLNTYNEKPVLTRPQHLYFHGPNYLEVDLDMHTYAYLARTAMVSFMTRLSSVVWECAFVVQGNSTDELPEQVLACARVYRTDFAKPRPFTSFLSHTPQTTEEEELAARRAAHH